MARGQRKSVENKILEKETNLSLLQKRIKSEQKELEDLYSEKKLKDLEFIETIIKTSGLCQDEILEALESYVSFKQQSQNAS